MKKLDVFMYGLLVFLSINALYLVHESNKNNLNYGIMPSTNDIVTSVIIIFIIGFIAGIITHISH